MKQIQVHEELVFGKLLCETGSYAGILVTLLPIQLPAQEHLGYSW